MAALQEPRRSASDFPFGACVWLRPEACIVMSEWPIVVLGFDNGLLGGEATLIFFALFRTGEDPDFQSFITCGATARRVRAGRKLSHHYAMGRKGGPR
jgi:hypothetical protein